MPATADERLDAAARQRPALRASLLEWFDRARRDLPWRRTSDPYAIWISEVMLQQTQVDRVVPYFERFLERFPTVTALAAATVEDVLGVWRGLGYYSRARNLHAAACVVAGAHAGRLPDEVEGLLALPGFGRYTAGAVASIAFGREAPLVDGNVARVLSRLFELDAPPGDKAREALLWQLAATLVRGERPGDFNQALMELGATVCTPASPTCLLCPVRAWCRAQARGRQAEVPPAKKQPPRKRLELAVALAQRGELVLLARRAERGLFGGLWELPSLPLERGDNAYASLRKLFGKRATIGPEMLVLERTLTHRDLVLRLFPVALPPRLKAPPDGYVEWRWVPRAETRHLGMSSAMETALDEALPPAPSTPKRPRRAARAR
ncbi:MAG: A/G-specific adenine glycosylase [Myxococcaceae bacterium]|nr:A/G-specific adenine glycosylase [Myxococcaceae bacterium]